MPRSSPKFGDAPAQYREIGERLHAIIRESAPSLEPIVRWGLPFYQKDGKDICHKKRGSRHRCRSCGTGNRRLSGLCHASWASMTVVGRFCLSSRASFPTIWTRT
jgi:hypothetical protein